MRHRRLNIHAPPEKRVALEKRGGINAFGIIPIGLLDLTALAVGLQRVVVGDLLNLFEADATLFHQGCCLGNGERVADAPVGGTVDDDVLTTVFEHQFNHALISELGVGVDGESGPVTTIEHFFNRFLVVVIDNDLGGINPDIFEHVHGADGAFLFVAMRRVDLDRQVCLQSELGLVSGRVHEIKEKERKPTSCPVLFSWNGDSFEFVADFLGVGGLGYFEAPGRYSAPDPTELLWIPRLEARENAEAGASYELRVLEPLEECTYLDSAALVAVDHPGGTTVLPNEMFAILGPAPGYGLLSFEEKLHPLKAIDQDGADMTSRVQKLDAAYAPELKPDRRFMGVLEKPQAVELEFPASLDELIRSDAPGRPVLFLYGYIEYGYSTTNFSASQAGFVPMAPSFRVERDGKWETLREEWGFPAGYPRWMSVDLADLLRPGDRRLKIDTNLEIAWDEVFIARARDVDLRGAGDEKVTVRQLKADRAHLHYRGFPIDPAPGEEVEGFLYKEFAEWTHYKVMPGSYTRFGDVRPLLEEDDGRFVIFGPGDEIEFSFRADRLGELAPGGRRTFFWKSGGYCKDMDFYTGHGDGVAPLPFAGMKSYPYAEGESYPADPALGRYAREWNTRKVEGDLRTPISAVVGD